MSTIYIQEPPTHGKVLLETTVGDIDVELWAREAPKACRNFVQLCMEGYYDGTLFHRVVKEFIVQGGDPTGTGEGGDSIYGRPFKDEFHTRLRFVRRGLVAMANAGKDDNGSQFFFTMAQCPELQNKHTIFGKVAGDTLYNMLKLEDGLVDHSDRPLYPHKILATKVLLNPFTDIVPRVLPNKGTEKASESKIKVKGTKNFQLLSFGDEAEEDEEETNTVAKEYRGKSKSSHDLTDDPNLSSLPAVESKDCDKRKTTEVQDDEKSDTESKNRRTTKKRKGKDLDEKPDEEEETSENEEISKKRKIEKIKKEFQQLKKELVSDKKNKNKEPKISEETVEIPQDEALTEYYDTIKKYVPRKITKVNKDMSHEAKTLAMLEEFKTKIESALVDRSEDEEKEKVETKPVELEEGEEDDNDEGWMTHSLHFESNERAAKDANIANEDTFEIFDPRNPINQRRREASKLAMSNKKRK